VRFFIGERKAAGLESVEAVERERVLEYLQQNRININVRQVEDETHSFSTTGAQSLTVNGDHRQREGT